MLLPARIVVIRIVSRYFRDLASDNFPGAEDFGDAPGLGEAAARGEGRVAIEDFADGAEARFG